MSYTYFYYTIFQFLAYCACSTPILLLSPFPFMHTCKLHSFQKEVQRSLRIHTYSLSNTMLRIPLPFRMRPKAEFPDFFCKITLLVFHRATDPYMQNSQKIQMQQCCTYKNPSPTYFHVIPWSHVPKRRHSQILKFPNCLTFFGT